MLKKLVQNEFNHHLSDKLILTFKYNTLYLRIKNNKLINKTNGRRFLISEKIFVADAIMSVDENLPSDIKIILFDENGKSLLSSSEKIKINGYIYIMFQIEPKSKVILRDCFLTILTPLENEKNTNINIVGSCISRDIFRIANKDVKIYIARTSFASQFIFNSPNISISENTKLGAFQKKIVEYENVKILKKEIKKFSGIVVIDLFDELLAQYVYNDKMVCLSSYVKDESVKIPHFEKYHCISVEEKLDLFKKGFDIFCNEVKLNPNIDSVYILRIKDCLNYNDNSPVNNYIGNKLDKYYEYIEQNHLSVCNIISPPNKHLVGNVNHIWSKSPYHFIDEFYEHCYNEIFYK